MMGSCGMRPSEVKTLVDVLDTDDDGDMVSWCQLLERVFWNFCKVSLTTQYFRILHFNLAVCV